MSSYPLPPRALVCCTTEPKSDIHSLASQKTAVAKLQAEMARKEEACHYLQLILERLQQQILAERTELLEHISTEDLQCLLQSQELAGTIEQAQNVVDSDDDDDHGADV